MNEYAPKDRIRKIIISESPPKDQGYVYLKTTKCTERKFCHHVFYDLGYWRSNDATIDEGAKESFLRRMQDDEVLIMDCCLCSVNQMSHYFQREERNRLVATCFKEHVGKELDRIFKEYHPKLFFKFPFGRGDEVFQILKDKYGKNLSRIPYDGSEPGNLARTDLAGSPSAIHP